MKIRTGLVSNSSSTSFAVYGIELKDSLTYKEVLKRLKESIFSSRFRFEKSDWYDSNVDSEEDLAVDLLREGRQTYFKICETKTLLDEEISIIYLKQHNIIGYGFHGEEPIRLYPHKVGDLFVILSQIFDFLLVLQPAIFLSGEIYDNE